MACVGDGPSCAVADGLAVAEAGTAEVDDELVSFFFGEFCSRLEEADCSLTALVREFPTWVAAGRSLIPATFRDEAYGVFGGTGPAEYSVRLSRFWEKLLPLFWIEAELLFVVLIVVKTTSSLLDR